MQVSLPLLPQISRFAADFLQKQSFILEPVTIGCRTVYVFFKEKLNGMAANG